MALAIRLGAVLVDFFDFGFDGFDVGLLEGEDAARDGRNRHDGAEKEAFSKFMFHEFSSSR